MKSSLRITLGSLAFAAGISLFAAACADHATSPTTSPSDGRIRINTPTLTLYGPDSITSSGNYVYYASFVVPYPSFTWYARSCATLTVDSCAGAWNQQFSGIVSDGLGNSNFTHHLNKDCTGGGTKSYQVKVTASGFGQAPQTLTKATKLCAELP